MAYSLESKNNLGEDVELITGSPMGLLLAITYSETTIDYDDGYTRESENSASFTFESKNNS